MKILTVVSNYPHAGHRFSGIFNERSVDALRERCETIEVLAPRPYFPRYLSRMPLWGHWESYAAANPYEKRNQVAVYRPAYLQVPKLFSAFWQDKGAFLCTRRIASQMHYRVGFEVILSFDLVASGGLAWRLGKHLGIPATGWATGVDVRRKRGTALHKVLMNALNNLDLVFYQNRELFEIATGFLRETQELNPTEKHVVLSRGTLEPPPLAKDTIRNRVRASLGILEDDIVVLNIGRVTIEKGILELLDSISWAIGQNPKIKCVIVGSKPAFDETVVVKHKLKANPNLEGKVLLLPECSPDKVWDYLCAGDLFAFASHKEGMPNSLLEAMSIGLPSIAFAIPPVAEIDAGSGGVMLVPPLDSSLFCQAILRLASSPSERSRIGEIGKEQVMVRFMVRKNMAKALEHLERIVQKESKVGTLKEKNPSPAMTVHSRGNSDVFG